MATGQSDSEAYRRSGSGNCTCYKAVQMLGEYSHKGLEGDGRIRLALEHFPYARHHAQVLFAHQSSEPTITLGYPYICSDHFTDAKKLRDIAKVT